MIYRSETEAAPRYAAAVLLRFLCHYLVDSVPDIGLTELAESTIALFNYYQMPRSSAAFSISEQRQIPATLGKVFESPGFHVELE